MMGKDIKGVYCLILNTNWGIWQKIQFITQHEKGYFKVNNTGVMLRYRLPS